MKLAIFGATGGLGRHVVRLALERGHEVRALARTPSKLAEGEGLEVVQGDFGDAPAVARTLAEADAVINCVGYAKGVPPSTYGEGMRHVIAAMDARGVSRLVSISGAGLEMDGDASGLGRRIIIGLLKTLAKDVLDAKRLEWEVIRDSDVAWTLGRVARMVEKPGRGSVEVALDRVSGSPIVPYPDVAAWMLDQLESDEFLRAAPFVSGA